MDKEKKLKIIFGVTFSFNILESVFLPFILLTAIALGFSSIAFMWALLIVALALWCGSGVTSNIIAGRHPKKLWFASIAPFAFLLPACFFASSSEASDTWLIISITFLLNLLICFVPFLISMSRHRKRNKNVVDCNKDNIKENNESV